MTDYTGFKISEMHAIVGIDPQEQSECIPAVPCGIAMLPLISTDRVRLDAIVAMAQEVADETGLNFKIVKFTNREDVGEIKSNKTKE